MPAPGAGLCAGRAAPPFTPAARDFRCAPKPRWFCAVRLGAATCSSPSQAPNRGEMCGKQPRESCCRGPGGLLPENPSTRATPGRVARPAPRRKRSARHFRRARGLSGGWAVPRLVACGPVERRDAPVCGVACGRWRPSGGVAGARLHLPGAHRPVSSDAAAGRRRVAALASRSTRAAAEWERPSTPSRRPRRRPSVAARGLRCDFWGAAPTAAGGRAAAGGAAMPMASCRVSQHAAAALSLGEPRVGPSVVDPRRACSGSLCEWRRREQRGGSAARAAGGRWRRRRRAGDGLLRPAVSRERAGRLLPSAPLSAERAGGAGGAWLAMRVGAADGACRCGACRRECGSQCEWRMGARLPGHVGACAASHVP